MNGMINKLNLGKDSIRKARARLNDEGASSSFFDKVKGTIKYGANELQNTVASTSNVVTDTLPKVWDGIPGNDFVADKTGIVVDHLPFNNSAEASVRALLGQEHIALDDDAIQLIQNDPAFKEYENQILNNAEQTVAEDPRYGKEAFSIRIDENNNTEPDIVKFGGETAEGDKIQQAKEFYKPKNLDTWKVGGRDLTWLLRHAEVEAVANVDANGDITSITYTVSDVLDLRPGEGREDAYNKVTSILGPIWHDTLGAEESDISGTWTVPVSQ